MSVESKNDIIIDSLIGTINKRGADIDELKAKFDELKAENNELKAENNKLKAENNKLKAENDELKSRRFNESKVDNNDSQLELEIIYSDSENEEDNDECNTTQKYPPLEKFRKKVRNIMLTNDKMAAIERSELILNKLNEYLKVEHIGIMISNNPGDVPKVTERKIIEVCSSWHRYNTFKTAVQKYRQDIGKYIRN